jgi:hypothetical protein
MPQWLLDSLKNHKLSKEEKSSVINNVIRASEKHDKQAIRIIPTEQDLHTRFNI